jgi:hypothetical protein
LNKKRRGLLRSTPPDVAPAGELAGLPARGSPKLKDASCQKHIGEKGTLCHAQSDFYHLSKLRACDNRNQHIEMIREIPESFTGARLIRVVVRNSAAA